MNLALLIENLEVGGSEAVVQRLALGLARRGHRVFLYCLRKAAVPIAHLRAAGVTVRESDGSNCAARLLPVLLRWFRQDRIELAHAHCVSAVLYAFPIARLLSIPLVHVWHGWNPQRPTPRRQLAALLARHLDGVGINSASLRWRLPRCVPRRKLVHLPNGIDLPPPDPTSARQLLADLCGTAPRGPLVLSIGNIRADKDQATLLKAAALLRQRWPSLRVVVVGLWQEQAYGAELRRLHQSLGLQDTVIFAGPVPDAWRLLAGADVFCLSSARESMPNVVLEAMSQGTPIVATAVGDLGSLRPTTSRLTMLRHGATALLVPPGQPRALAAALARTLRDLPAARRRAERAQADYQRRYTGEMMVRRYEEFYRRCRSMPRQRSAPRRLSVLMVGPPAEDLGGMATSITRLLHSPLKHHYLLDRFSLTSAGRSNIADTPVSPTGGRRPTWSSVRRHLAALHALAARLLRGPLDIVHIHTCSYFTFHRNVLDAVLARLLGKRVILHVRGGRFEEFCARAHGWTRAWIRLGFAVAHAVVVLTPDWRRRLAPYVGSTPVHVVPNGVEVEHSARPGGQRGGPCRFLYLAALTRAKGLDDLLEAARRLHAAGVDFHLVVAGPSPDVPIREWQRRVAAAGLTTAVSLVGAVRDEAKRQLLASVDCFVHPSHCEALPNAVLEAAAVGLPVIATAVGGVPALLGANQPDGPYAPLVPPGDPAALAAALRTLANDPPRRRQIGERLRRHVAAHYSLAETARRLDALYRQLRCPQATLWPNLAAALVRQVTYPLHERLRGRPTYRELAHLRVWSQRTPTELHHYVCQRLRELLLFAGGSAADGTPRLPYYAELFHARALNADAADPLAELRKLPVLTKAALRLHGEQMTFRQVPGGLRPACSGGTTGETAYFFMDAQRQAQDLAARLFMQSLFGVQPGERRAHLWGSPLENGRCRLRRWRDRLLNEFLLDAFDMSPPRCAAHLRRIAQLRPAVLYGYTSAIVLLAQYANRRCRPTDFPWLKLVVLTGEETTREQREFVSATFGCPAASEYGNREVGLIAHDCPHGRLHILAPHIFVEIVNDGRPLPDGCCGEVICTPLNARAQPLLRYRVGDLGRRLPAPCPCGLPLPTMEVLGGKTAGFLVLPDGRLCHGAVSSHALRGIDGIVAFRTHQRQIDRIEVALVVNEQFRRESVQLIQNRYRALFGPRVRIDCRLVDELPPDPSGKRRHVISDVAARLERFELVETNAFQIPPLGADRTEAPR